MSIPQFSETWGSSYLQSVIALLIFFASLPLIIVQLSIDEDIRKIYIKYIKKWIYIISIAISIITALILTWVIHPCPDIIAEPWQSIIISILLTILLCMFFFIIRALFKQGRESLIKLLIKRIVNSDTTKQGSEPLRNKICIIIRKVIKCKFTKDIPDKKPHRSKCPKLDKEHDVVNGMFFDLTYLGEYGKPGMEKNDVIRQVSCLSDRTIASDKVDTLMLHKLYYALFRTLDGDTEHGSEDNYNDSLEVFISIKTFLIEKIETSRTNATDLMTELNDILYRCSVKCLKFGYTDTALLYVQALSDKAEQLFKISKEEIKIHNYNVPVTCLNIIEGLMEDNNSNRPAHEMWLIGLIGWLWHANKLSRKRIEISIQNLYYEDSTPHKQSIKLIKSICDEVINSFMEIQDYTTASYVLEFSKEFWN